MCVLRGVVDLGHGFPLVGKHIFTVFASFTFNDGLRDCVNHDETFFDILPAFARDQKNRRIELRYFDLPVPPQPTDLLLPATGVDLFMKANFRPRIPGPSRRRGRDSIGVASGRTWEYILLVRAAVHRSKARERPGDHGNADPHGLDAIQT